MTQEPTKITFEFEKGIPHIMECIDIAIGENREYEGTPEYNKQFLSTLLSCVLNITYNEGHDHGYAQGTRSLFLEEK